MKDELRKIIRVKHFDILKSISKGNRTKTKIAKDTNTTYAHIIKLLEKYKGMGLIKAEKYGRDCRVNFELKGWQLFHDFEGIFKKIYN